MYVRVYHLLMVPPDGFTQATSYSEEGSAQELRRELCVQAQHVAYLPYQVDDLVLLEINVIPGLVDHTVVSGRRSSCEQPLLAKHIEYGRSTRELYRRSK